MLFRSFLPLKLYFFENVCKAVPSRNLDSFIVLKSKSLSKRVLFNEDCKLQIKLTTGDNFIPYMNFAFIVLCLSENKEILTRLGQKEVMKFIKISRMVQKIQFFCDTCGRECLTSEGLGSFAGYIIKLDKELQPQNLQFQGHYCNECVDKILIFINTLKEK